MPPGAAGSDSMRGSSYDAPVATPASSDGVTVHLAGASEASGRSTPVSAGAGDNAQLLAERGGLGGAGRGVRTRAASRNAVGGQRYTQPRCCTRHGRCVRISLVLLAAGIALAAIVLAVAFTSTKRGGDEAWREFSQEERWFESQVLDHTVGAASGTWRQRYFVVDKFWRAPDGAYACVRTRASVFYAQCMGARCVPC